MKRRTLIFLVILVVLVLGGISLALIVGRLPFRQTSEPSQEVPTPIPTSTLKTECTRYTDEEYGFSLCYPPGWPLPEGEKIVPSQQHLYRTTLNPREEEYYVDIYNQPSPVSLGSFVRDYFKDVEGGVGWTNDIKVNDQETLQFFVSGLEAPSMGFGGVAFGKKGYVLTITTSTKEVPEGDFKQLVDDEVLTQLTESFVWIE